jgi:hypothetical protein
MRMSELVSSMGLTVFPIIGLIGFGAAFVLILLRVARTRTSEARANAAIPLDDGLTCPDHNTPQQARAEGGAA